MQHHSIPAAAARLGLSVDTVRRRLRSGAIEGELSEGKWTVWLPEETPTHTNGQEEVNQALRERIVAQDAMTQTLTQQIAELHQIIARMATPALPEPRHGFWTRLLRR